MESKERFHLRNALEQELLEIIDERDDMTRSDLQGRVMAFVMKVLPLKAHPHTNVDEDGMCPNCPDLITH
jgi:hypothetical protein